MAAFKSEAQNLRWPEAFALHIDRQFGQLGRCCDADAVIVHFGTTSLHHRLDAR
jgi:hypothetical protein